MIFKWLCIQQKIHKHSYTIRQLQQRWCISLTTSIVFVLGEGGSDQDMDIILPLRNGSLTHGGTDAEGTEVTSHTPSNPSFWCKFLMASWKEGLMCPIWLQHPQPHALCAQLAASVAKQQRLLLFQIPVPCVCYWMGPLCGGGARSVSPLLCTSSLGIWLIA